MRVVLTEKAIADLIRIGRFIQEDNPARAVTFAEELEELCQGLAGMARASPLLPGREQAGIPSPIPRQLPDFLSDQRG